MKDNNNKRMNNQGRNNNHRNVTFADMLSDVIRRNSTIPQAVSGELRIVNGDVEGGIAVYCSNAAYRDKLLKEAEPETSKAIGTKEAVATKSNEATQQEVHCQNETEKLNQELEAYWANPDNDITRRTIESLIELEIISDFTYELDCHFAFINGKAYEGEIGSILRDVTNISEERAKAINNVISDAAGCDITIKARKKNGRILYRVTAEPKTGFVRCADNETMAQFINKITKN